MKEYIDPNFEDDKVQPSNIDFRWFAKMMMYALIVLWIISASIYTGIYFIVWWLSLEDEKRFFWELFIDETYEVLDLSFLSRDITLSHNIYISPSPEVNAYATLWWNIIFTRWILESFNNEEEFVFVLWHEAWHIENRDIMNYYTRQLPVYLTLLLMGVNLDTGMITNVFSQSQEMGADRAWLAFIDTYGYNSDCVLWFFEDENILLRYLGNIGSTHPSNRARIRQIREYSVHSDTECTEINISYD